MAEQPSHYKAIIRIFGFLAKYGSQPIDSMMTQPVSLLSDVADSIADIMEEEKQLSSTDL